MSDTESMNPSSPWWSVTPELPTARVVGRKRAKIKVAFLFILFFTVMVLAAFWAPSDKPYTLSDGSTQYPASLNDLIASCKGVVTWPTTPEAEVGWLPESGTHKYLIFPPTSGTFSALAAKPGEYPLNADNAPTIPQAMSALWRGAIVIWYEPDMEKSKIESLLTIASERPGNGTYVVAPWPSTKSNNWSAKNGIMITSWGRSQSCDIASFDVLTAFAQAAAEHPAPGADVPYTETGPRLAK